MNELVLLAAPYLAAVATAICALELLVVQRASSERGVFAWSVLRDEYGPLRPVFDVLFSSSGVLVLLTLQLAAAVALPLVASPTPAWIAAATTLLIAVRFRGTFNGGSDSMLLVVLLGHAVVRTWPGTTTATVASWYVIVQLTASYFIAGIVKLREPKWRNGTALAVLVTLPHYRVPASLQRVLSQRTLGWVATVGMLALECAFPIALIDHRLALGFALAGGLFHATNAVVFGLNRFWWAWLAAYPFLLAR